MKSVALLIIVILRLKIYFRISYLLAYNNQYNGVNGEVETLTLTHRPRFQTLDVALMLAGCSHEPAGPSRVSDVNVPCEVLKQMSNIVPPLAATDHCGASVGLSS